MKRYYILAFYILFIAETATAQEEKQSASHCSRLLKSHRNIRPKPKLHDTLIVQLTGTTASSVQTICRPLR